MWLQRVLFNIRHRLLSQKTGSTTVRSLSGTVAPKAEEQRAKVIHNRIADLDEQCAKLQIRQG
jgi:hypothetical protein